MELKIVTWGTKNSQGYDGMIIFHKNGANDLFMFLG